MPGGRLLAAARAVDEVPPACRRWVAFAWCAAALAVLAKGLIGVVLAARVLLPWLVATRHWRAIPSLLHPAGRMVFAVLAVPWLMLPWSLWLLAAGRLFRRGGDGGGTVPGEQLQRGDRVAFVNEAFFDVPVLARPHSPPIVLADWQNPDIDRRDDWRKELKDAARFDPAAAATPWVPIDRAATLGRMTPAAAISAAISAGKSALARQAASCRRALPITSTSLASFCACAGWQKSRPPAAGSADSSAGSEAASL